MTVKIIHIATESQFTAFAVGEFESVAPHSNTVILTSAWVSGGLKYPLPAGVEVVRVSGLRGAFKIWNLIRGADLVVAHGLTIYGAIAFLTATKETIKMWSGWGYDYYSDLGGDSLISKQTIEFLGSNLENSKVLEALKAIKNKINRALMECASKRADLFSAPIPTDYDVFLKRFSKFSGIYAQLNYGNSGSLFEKCSAEKSASNILIGNSASATNNHIDVFNLIAKKDLSKVGEIIVPLTYGDSSYRDLIVNKGREIFGAKFFPIIHHMPIDEYSKIISSCNVVIMNHYRQQGIGNIGAAIFGGAHVFLSEKSPAYAFFHKIGVDIRSVEDLATNDLPIGLPSNWAVDKNRSAIQSFWGDTVVRKNTIRIVELIKSKKPL